MNDPVIERVAREDPARFEPLTMASYEEQAEAMRARLLSAIDQGPPDRAPRRRFAAVGLLPGVAVSVVVVVAVLLVAFAHHAGVSKPSGSGTRGRPSGVRAEPVRLYAAGVVDVGGSPQALLAHGDSLWVATPSSVVRLNLRDGSTLGRISIPTNGVNAGLAFGAGSMWLAATGNTQLLRIDPQTDKLIAKIPVGGRQGRREFLLGGGVAFAAGSVWATRTSNGPRGDVVAVNPSADRIAGTPVPVGSGPEAIVSGFGSLWIENTSVVLGSTPPDQTFPSMSRISLPGRAASSEPFSGTPAVGFGSVWIQTGNALSENAALVRYDPATERVLARIQVPRVVAAAFGDGRVWAISYPRSGSANTFTPVKGTAVLWQIDPRTNRIIGAPIHLQLTQPDAIAVSAGQLWIADYQSGTTLHFQLTPR